MAIMVAILTTEAEAALGETHNGPRLVIDKTIRLDTIIVIVCR
jgi:hypothetical protein